MEAQFSSRARLTLERLLTQAAPSSIVNTKEDKVSFARSDMAVSNGIIGTPTAKFNRALFRWFQVHKEKLWWLHSFYALALGMVIMWLGKQNFAYLRIAVFHISFIWLSSLFLPKLLGHPRLPSSWAPRIRLLINFFNKNFYQQMLFFVLPIYYASATLASRNIVFVLLVALSATLSTLDLIYDRHLSVKRSLTAVFFAFNLFALINVMLPVLWSVGNTSAMRMSAALAFLAFLTLYYPPLQSRIRRIAVILLIGFLLLVVVEHGRSYIPPAPLRLASFKFGTNLQQEALRIESPLTELRRTDSLLLFGLTAIQAPLGLKEKVTHRWYKNGKLICASPSYNIAGGREGGFRLWTSCFFDGLSAGAMLRLDLETDGGQLIGRASLRAVK